MGGLRAWVRSLVATTDERHVRLSLSEKPAPPEGSRSFAESHNDFTLALYRQLLPRPGNLVFSPFSVRAALGMTYAGARGQTAEQMSAAAGDDHPHDIVVELVALPRLAVIGKEAMEQLGEHCHLPGFFGSLVSVQHHFHHFSLHPIIGLPAFSGFGVPGATILRAVEGLGVGLEDRVGVGRSEG